MALTADTTDPLGPYRSELRALCYRMLGSFHDAEDVLQEISMRAWRGADRFEGRSSQRTWLHRIAVNACLNELERKERRVLPVDLGPPTGSGEPFAEPPGEPLWLEPYPHDPEQLAEDSESIELAFVVAVQQLPPNQRAALIMFEVLGFSAQEVADVMDTTPASVNSALQRSRERLGTGLPARSQRATLAELGDAGQQQLVQRYTTALREHDVDAMLTLLTEDATWSMPPLANWYRGHASIAAFLANGPFTHRWQHLPARANGQLAIGCYCWDEAGQAYLAYALDVLDLRGDRIASIVAFLGGERFPAFGLPPRFLD